MRCFVTSSYTPLEHITGDLTEVYKFITNKYCIDVNLLFNSTYAIAPAIPKSAMERDDVV